jgi:hypothetical protein
MRRDENDRNSAIFGIQLRLQLDTGHSGHTDIGY